MSYSRPKRFLANGKNGFFIFAIPRVNRSFVNLFIGNHMSQTKAEFGKWRSFFWPVHNFELKKLLPMFFLFFFINFNYTILRDTKDALIVTAPGSGAEAIPFLKVWGVLPAAILFMLIYAKLSNVLS